MWPKPAQHGSNFLILLVFSFLLSMLPPAFGNFMAAVWAQDEKLWQGHSECVLVREFVFTQAPFPNCHASTLVEGPKGLLCAWFGGTREGARDVGIWLSRYENGRWSTPVEIATGHQPDGTRLPCWNPVLFRPRNQNVVFLFYKVGPSPSSWWGMVMRSEDGGLTWSTPEKLPDGILGPIKNKLVQLDDRTWLCPSSKESPNRPSQWSVFFERTSDGGKTWESVEVPSGAVPLNAIQPTVFVAEEHTLVSLGRTREGRLFWTFSADGGRTWAPLQRSLLPNPNAGIDGITLRDGRHLIVYNPTTRGRAVLGVAISRDLWLWEAAVLLENQPGEYSYPAVIQTSDGLVHITYTWRHERIAHIVLDPAKIAGHPMARGLWPTETDVSQLIRKEAPIRDATRAPRPSVIIVMTDDQGLGDFSYFGNPVLRTPHLDRLFREGVLLTDFHVAPVCTPTRGQLMTGQDALRNGARTVPAGSNMIWPEIPTLPQVFRQAGYATGLFGKWHLGDHYPNRPLDRGFEKAIWHGGWGVSSDVEFDNDTMGIRYLDGTTVKQSSRYCTDLWFDEAISWMEQCRQQQRPFFCYIATNAPHSPFWAQDKDAVPYRGKVPPATAEFFGMIANIDENMGRLDDFLSTSQLKDDTIVIFLTDNGGTAGVRVFNAGLRGSKGSYYEGGHRVPCAIRWPRGGLQGGKKLQAPTQVQDLFPTLLELCELEPSQQLRFDGISLACALRDPDRVPLPERMFVIQYGRRTTAVKFDGCVVAGPWRLVNGSELYHVDKDRSQSQDLADQHPEVVAKLRAFYEKWWEGILPRWYDYQPIPVGTPYENPVILSSNYWAGVDVDNNRVVSEAAGGPRGGPWHIEVTESGTYVIELRRWPFHTDMAIASPGPSHTISVGR